MLFTPSGIVTLVRLLQSRNAKSPMYVTPSPMFTILTLSLFSYHGAQP